MNWNIRTLYKDYKDMYDGATTTMKSAAGLTGKFKVGVGLHQGSALSPFLLAIIKLTEDNKKDAPWDMLFADETVLSRQNHRELEDDLEIWRMHWRERAWKWVGARPSIWRLGVWKVEKRWSCKEKRQRPKNFKYLGSTISSDGRCEEKDPSRMDEVEEGVWNSVPQDVMSKS